MSPSSRTFRDLLASWRRAVVGTRHPQPPSYDGPNVRIRGFVEHSGEVEPDDCFVARVRHGSDGHPYIGQAVGRGASVILGQRPEHTVSADLRGTPYLQVPDTAVALAWLSAAWHDFPARRLYMIGITGTDGKTTTANFLYSVLRAAGLQSGLISTIRAVIGEEEEPLALHVTTPEAPVVQSYLQRMVDAGTTHCVLEATSHGLAQHRVGAIDFDLAVVTNITHEHLDYHGDYERYFAAKARLFENLSLPAPRKLSDNPFKEAVARTAILNRDDDSYGRLAELSVERQLTYGLDNASDVSAENLSFRADATRFQLRLPGLASESLKVSTTMTGRFNVYNMLAAAAAGHAMGLEPRAIVNGLQELKGLSGRMERIDGGQPFLVLVDFAHTPNGLEKAVGAARTMVSGRVITVIGSAGKRDVTKRRLIAEISARLADLTVLTAEDPRTESLADILKMMADGCRSHGGVEGQTFWQVPDRGRAIYHALSLAQANDLVLVCGKGHEQSMCFGTVEYPWDDRDAVRMALDALQSGRPMPDLGLPTF